ncbi:class IIb bacteriocin, lactobin A/cerein 7B family [Metabacillus malikii]|uniref:Lactobin A/cerein 7B family class IIb bacteriocin n=1 Tax=Metabacillus malikii TaxID=1504265 RepID=A0ABT9ZG16_9BACI|nr:class IIb bacteriocin, lactobin A/cerein 7B family [Metabacillus malikii]MDQ0230737.1 lactobin A/cerein 7B family class IIb bacteriocin [Metabacillus malikii]
MNLDIKGMKELNHQQMQEIDGGWVAVAWKITWRVGLLAAGAYAAYKADQD